MENRLFDVTALGELLIDFTEMEQPLREIPFLRQIPAVLYAMCLPCLAALAKKLLLLEK